MKKIVISMLIGLVVGVILGMNANVFHTAQAKELPKNEVANKSYNIHFYSSDDFQFIEKYENIFNECFSDMGNSDGFNGKLSMGEITGECSYSTTLLAENELKKIFDDIVAKRLYLSKDLEKSNEYWNNYRDTYCNIDVGSLGESSFCEMKLTVSRVVELNRINTLLSDK